MTNYTTQKTDQYGEVLLIDGKESICPFKPALAVPKQNALGQMVMEVINFPCCSHCPHVTLERLGKNDINHYIINCTGTERDLELNDGTEPEFILVNP